MISKDGFDLYEPAVPCKFCEEDTNRVLAITANEEPSIAIGIEAGESACLHCWIKFIAQETVKEILNDRVQRQRG